MNKTVRIAFDVRNELGEGPMWHPVRERLVWFDIPRRTLFMGNGDGTAITTFGFGEPVAAAFPLATGHVLVATASGLVHLDLDSGAITPRLAIEADNPVTRANDSRAAPGGSLWFGTMGRRLEPRAGAFYHVRDGVVTVLRTGISVPNATCFSPDGRRAYFCDTFDRQIRTCPIDSATGLPSGEPEIFADLKAEGLHPDGAVVDMAGNLWNAQFGASRVACYSPQGRFVTAIDLPASRVTCPAFGGPDLRTLYITTAFEGQTAEESVRQPLAGAVFAVEMDVPGQREHFVRDW